MNPYLEQYWRSVHARLIVAACDALNESLPEGLLAVVEERVYVELPDGYERAVYPDIKITRHKHLPDYQTPSATPTATVAPPRAQPLYIEFQTEPITETFINVIEPTGGRVITTIEVLSLANKLSGTGQAQYLKKQQETIQAGVNLVEIDLLRTGEWVVSIPEVYLHAPERTPYRVCVYRAERPTVREFYPIGLRERVPTIGVPLRPTDADVALDLQALVDRVYAQGRCHLLIDYAQPVKPPLSEGDAAWVEAVLQERGLRATQ